MFVNNADLVLDKQTIIWLFYLLCCAEQYFQTKILLSLVLWQTLLLLFDNTLEILDIITVDFLSFFLPAF